MRIVIAGATGLVGRRLVDSFLRDGEAVVCLTRRVALARSSLPAAAHCVEWDARTVDETWSGALWRADAVINLAGASIGARPWTKARKQEIRRSRVDATLALSSALSSIPAEQRPKVLVNASGIDYYGNRQDEAVDEDDQPGESFLARVCIEWEKAADSMVELGLRVVCVRTAVVLAREAMTLRLMAFPFRVFLGGPVSDGRQWFSWIHIDDVVGLYRLAVERSEVAGGLNAVAPETQRQSDVAREIASTLHRPSLVPVPALVLRLMLRDQADLLLHGRKAVPTKALAYGYSFRHPRLREALREALDR